MFARNLFRSFVDRLIRADSGGTSVEFVYLMALLVVMTAFGAAILSDDVAGFFRGFILDRNGLRYG